MRIVLAVLTLVLALGADAAERTYAALSLVGDGVLVVYRRATTGTNIARAEREFVPFPGPALDRAVLLAIDDAVRQAEPRARPVLLGGRDADAVATQARTLGEPAATQAIFDALRRRLPPTGATHLLLVVKSRHRAQFALRESYVGSGQVEGLGFYIDPTLRVQQQEETLAAGEGVLAPFAYFTVALVDLASGRVLAEEAVKESATVSQGGSDTLAAWDALSAERKVEMLQRLIGRGLHDAVPKLLAGP